MMGAEYGIYIWSAYGAAALAVVGLVSRAVIDHRHQVRALARLSETASQSDLAQDG